MSSVPSPIQLPLFAAKRCTACDRDDLTVDDFYVKVKATGQRLSWCKACHIKRTSAHVAAHREEYTARSLKWQAANPEKVREARQRFDATEHRKAYSRALEQRPDIKAARAAYKRSDAGKAAEQRYRENRADQRRAAAQAYYAANKDAVRARIRAARARHPDHYAATNSAWKKANKDKVNSYTHKRRYTLKGNGGVWCEADWQHLKAQWDWRCAMCGKQEMTDAITLCFDHIVPVSTGGWNLISNGQPLCRSCNSKKHRRFLLLRR